MSMFIFAQSSPNSFVPVVKDGCIFKGYFLDGILISLLNIRVVSGSSFCCLVPLRPRFTRFFSEKLFRKFVILQG